MKPDAFCRRERLNHAQFARLVGLSKPTISRLFNNGSPISLKNAIKIEEKTGGAVTRFDVRPDLRPLSRKQRNLLRQTSPMPETVSKTGTDGQPEQTAPAMQAAADQPANRGADNAATEA